MDLHTFAYERSSLSLDRQRSAFKVLFDRYLKDIEKYEEDLYAILGLALATEEYDGFGTEGLDV